MNDTTDFKQVFVRDIKDQITSMNRQANALSKFGTQRRGFRKRRQLAALFTKCRDKGRGFCGIIPRDEIADLQKIPFRKIGETKTHHARRRFFGGTR